MLRSRDTGRSTLVSGLAVAFVCACSMASADDEYSKVLGSVRVPSGQHIDSATTVNGSVEIGDNSVVKHAETVNGSITMRGHSESESVKTVNGSVTLEDGVRVGGAIELVNGHVSLARGADVTGRVSNVNGSITLDGAHVGGGIETTSGDIDINGASRVEGGILVNEDNDSWFHFFRGHDPRVVIGPGSVVKGQLRFHHQVKLYVSDRATIGDVDGATAVRFSGDHAPQDN
jgi:hypothetical protein